MLPIEWRASARADLQQILDFISERNEPAADRLFAQMQTDLEHAAEHPYLYKSSQRIPGLREIVTHPNYVIFYRVSAEYIEVVTVVHARREFPGRQT